MFKMKKVYFFTAIMLMAIGAGILLSVQYIMHKTNSTEFCVSCHSMSFPQEEWETSVHFSNPKGIRANCADCHVPPSGLHYLKAKILAVKDIWYEMMGKIPDREAYEKHRYEMAKRVWDDMKATNSETCRSCHSLEAMEISSQSKSAQTMHELAKKDGQTCIDCHKGIVHFPPEIPDDVATNNIESPKTEDKQILDNSKPLYNKSISTAQTENGSEVRLMPYATLTDWNNDGQQITAELHGWQQAGAESIIYMELGKRIIVALLEEEAKSQVKVIKTIQDEVTDSEWKEVLLTVKIPQGQLTTDLTALNQVGNQLNQTHCSSCHAVISADHFTANQWIGVVNSMKDRTALTAEEVRILTIYLQRNSKDIVSSAH
ncbi:trimethylamine-N-oxide reductase (cytochrome c) cytochrome c-type subunit TorY [Bisgaardia hudsonensis]|uniref:Cytochrome c-type protein n=1 Tax=Bisgaardia hudsonensis TaxID=109472 RepID=A0A4R2N1G1_9PAST|nr:NapC/NirT family cytochrome c [Bisgaardia hudsonensis]QLB13067.1 nitrate reductase [Bisgaardia hudsonensis]TCP13366.1 trimethylamine-N-oxide reductase (cytochrome c) cytochrome c-type subunit TorY [Bisgaardia hudsonensis]